MIRVLIGRVLRWFIDAAEDADALKRHRHRRSFDFSHQAKALEQKQQREQGSAELADGFFTTDGRLELEPATEKVVRKEIARAQEPPLVKPIDIPFRRGSRWR